MMLFVSSHRQKGACMHTISYLRVLPKECTNEPKPAMQKASVTDTLLGLTMTITACTILQIGEIGACIAYIQYVQFL